MALNKKWKIPVVVLLVITLILLANIQKNLKLKVTLEAYSQSEINWIAKDGLWFGGTYADRDGDGEVTVKLPPDTTLITIGREFGNEPNISVMKPTRNQLLSDDVPARCPVILSNNSDYLLNICTLPTDNFATETSLTELDVIAGEIVNMKGFSSRNASLFLSNSPSVRYASIEVLDPNLTEDLPVFTGGGQLLGYDELSSNWDIFSSANFVD